MHVTNEELSQKLDKHQRDTDAIKLALFGDENTDGMVDQVKQMNDLIVGAKFLAATLKVLLLVGAVVAMFWSGAKWLKDGNIIR